MTASPSLLLLPIPVMIKSSCAGSWNGRFFGFRAMSSSTTRTAALPEQNNNISRPKSHLVMRT